MGALCSWPTILGIAYLQGVHSRDMSLKQKNTPPNICQEIEVTTNLPRKIAYGC